jgi:hypothetical protein
MGPAGTPKKHSSNRSALLAGGIAIVLVAVVLVAHAVHGTPTAAGAGSSPASSMNMSAGTGATGAMGSVPTVRGAALPAMQTSGAMPVAMAMVPLGNATWDGMRIQARTSAPATFVLFNGTSQQVVHPTAKTSFHLMILLSDKGTGVAIPYSSVWATVRKGGKVVFDERLWPMISRYMGPHYGNNVALPSAGVYHMSLLVSPPEAARHLEYKNLWLKPHRVNLTFRWAPRT